MKIKSILLSLLLTSAVASAGVGIIIDTSMSGTAVIQPRPYYWGYYEYYGYYTPYTITYSSDYYHTIYIGQPTYYRPFYHYRGNHIQHPHR